MKTFIGLDMGAPGGDKTAVVAVCTQDGKLCLHGCALVCKRHTFPRKPHLRLRYTPEGAAGNRSGAFPWSVEYMRGPSQRARRETYQHDRCWGALQSAALLWF